MSYITHDEQVYNTPSSYLLKPFDCFVDSLILFHADTNIPFKINGVPKSGFMALYDSISNKAKDFPFLESFSFIYRGVTFEVFKAKFKTTSTKTS